MGKHELHIHSIKAHHISRLTRRDEGVLDSMALDDIAQYVVHTLNDVSVESLHIAHSTIVTLCSALLRNEYIAPGKAELRS